MGKYNIMARRVTDYSVIVEANSEEEALAQVDDWIADDFEDFAIDGLWEMEVEALWLKR